MEKEQIAVLVDTVHGHWGVSKKVWEMEVQISDKAKTYLN
jgi:hypothetical protein